LSKRGRLTGNVSASFRAGTTISIAGQEVFSSEELAEEISALDESMVTGHQKNPRKRSRYPQARNVIPPVDNRKISQKLMQRDPRLKKFSWRSKLL
jgi:hypothetical protein